MRETTEVIAKLRISSNRSYGGEGDIKILAEDIKINGLINPVTVKPATDDEDTLEVVAGRRRVRAAALLGWEKIRCRVLVGDEIKRADEIAGAENINRLGMHPLDEAAIFKTLLENGETLQALAKRMDRKVNEIYQRLQLLDLTDGVKTLFRNGVISLHSAAMLKTLDEEGQKAFCEKYKKEKEIGDWAANSFVSQRQHDTLYKCITDNQCETCKTRTFFEDKSLFPELHFTKDSCLNHDCYLKKWVALLTEKMKNIKTRNKTHEEATLIAYDDQSLRKILGKEIKLGDTKYTLTRSVYNNPDSKPGKNSKPCFRFSLSDGGSLKIEAVYWKEEKQSSKVQPQRPVSESSFAPAVRVLGLPKEEAAAVIKKLDANAIKMSYWQLDSKLQQKHFWPLLADRLTMKPSEADIEWYFKNTIFERFGETDKKIYKLLLGKEFSEKQLPELAKLPKERLFLLMSALKFDYNDLPDPSDLERGRNTDFLEWLGVSKEKVKELYRADLAELLPKAESKPQPEKKEEKAKPAGKKPARKKLPSAKKIAKVNAAKGKKK